MDKHIGQIVEYTVRKNGYSITDLGRELGVNRRTIYNYFENKHLKQNVIFKIGIIIRHDFSKDFPELFTAEEFVPINKTSSINVHNLPVNDSDQLEWKDKYLSLLEKFNELLQEKVAVLLAIGLFITEIADVVPLLSDCFTI